MFRRTKIVATLGPATDDPRVLDDVIAAGVDVVRLNMSHGSHEEQAERAESVRNRARASGRQVGVLVDLQGPKIRIGRFVEGYITLDEGDEFSLDLDCPEDAGNQQSVNISYEDLITDVSRGDTLLLDDGAVVLWVNEVSGSRVNCRVTVGGKLSDRKGLNKLGGGLSAPALTEKDKQDIIFAASIEADYLAVSFVRNAEDVNVARSLLKDAGGKAGIVAKIERAEALNDIEGIIDASDVIMVARGDLGVEVGDAELPAIQKNLISMARSKNGVVITATQMMQSMIDSPIPTRAEVFDVANSVLDGTDAVMLSAETAAGQFPAKAIETMGRICVEAEKQKKARRSHHRLNSEFEHIDEAVAMSSMYAANHLGVAAIAALTESGSTALWMSRISSGIPIYALSQVVATRRKVTLYRGVCPLSFEVSQLDPVMVVGESVEELLRRGAVREGDLVIVTKGGVDGLAGGTDTLRIVKVGKHLAEEQPE
ncbi:MAG: pyruvate kinase [gamma proteobacterium symbiont of Bathyaustriella thionipta]|nr:pyruvate kinase [gamma proteobacterium symbiont of Bathyaustriella thionipta]